MIKVNEQLLDGIRNGNDWAVATVDIMAQKNNLPEAEVNRLWEAVIEGAFNGHQKVAELGLRVDGMTQDAEGGRIYGSVWALTAAPKAEAVYSPTIATGAAVVRAQNDTLEIPGFDKEKFLKLAKRGLINVVRNGNPEAQPFAVEALRNFRDKEGIRAELLAIARERKDPRLMNAIIDSLMQLGLEGQLELVQRDKKMLYSTTCQDETLPGRLYIDMMFDAVEKVLLGVGNPEKNDEITIALTQLARSGIKGGPGGDLLDEASLEVVQKNVEDALLYALISGDKEQKEKAGEGLASIGGERVVTILSKLVRKEMPSEVMSERGKAAKAVLARIYGDVTPKDVVSIPPPVPKAAQKGKQKPRLRVR